MKKKLLGLFAALSMILTGVVVSVAPVEAQAQSYRHHRGSYGVYRGPGIRRGYRGYRGGRYYRGYRGYRGRSYRVYRGRGYRADRRAYRAYRYDRRALHYGGHRHYR